ncbi:MAG TPA: NUDIX domain-containing protein [Actinomycetes bacterium]|nr:NUDIX domain-containing protein [Actinomycetes bacterium]
MERDGNGWVECHRGHRHWGVHGAAGLLLHTVDESGGLRLLLQHRADWCHHGGTWGLPGGARDSHETVEEAALREAYEETELDVTRVRVRHTFVDDHGGWCYTTVYGDTTEQLGTNPNEESAELVWTMSDEVSALPLHPGFGSTWQQVQLPGVALLVDAANVVGSVPDGWWADRAGATTRLASRLATMLATTVPVNDRAGVVTSLHLVLEGKARSAAVESPVHAISAPHSGDDTIVEEAARLSTAGRQVLVVTSDRELRRRVTEVSSTVHVHGAKWLRNLLDEPAG